MGELNTPLAPERLIGSAYEPDGHLTRAVRAQPFCVLLFDEIEKAHPSVLNLLLQLLDDGRLTDASGSVADFTHAVVVMTSNLGAGVRRVGGFVDDAGAVKADIARAIREFFPPELFNRIDRVVPFDPLSRSDAESIARKELGSSRPGRAWPSATCSCVSRRQWSSASSTRRTSPSTARERSSATSTASSGT